MEKNNFYETLLEEKSVEDLIKENSNLKASSLEQNVSEIMPYEKKEITNTLNENYKAVKIMDKETRGALFEVGKKLVYFPFRLITATIFAPTSIRKFNEKFIEEEKIDDLRLSASVATLIVGTGVSLYHILPCLKGEGDPLSLGLSISYLTTNTLSGGWEWLRYERNKIRENKNGKK